MLTRPNKTPNLVKIHALLVSQISIYFYSIRNEYPVYIYRGREIEKNGIFGVKGFEFYEVF